jgi:hypothetical protein
MKTWDELKARGSLHYRTDGVQPIDLYRDLGIFRPFALASIIKYATRNVGGGPYENPVSARDMMKIIHYAELLIASCSGISDHISDDNEMVYPPIVKGK